MYSVPVATNASLTWKSVTVVQLRLSRNTELINGSKVKVLLGHTNLISLSTSQLQCTYKNICSKMLMRRPRPHATVLPTFYSCSCNTIYHTFYSQKITNSLCIFTYQFGLQLSLPCVFVWPVHFSFNPYPLLNFLSFAVYTVHCCSTVPPQCTFFLIRTPSGD